MASNIQKQIKYDKDIHPQQYFDLCGQGFSLTKIATKMGTCKDQLLGWASDTRKHEWQAVWQRGKESCQAYHEDILDQMIRGTIKADSKSKELQQYRMKVMFKEDWAEKQESKVVVSHIEQMPTDELNSQISNIVQRLTKTRPDLKIVDTGKIVNGE